MFTSISVRAEKTFAVVIPPVLRYTYFVRLDFFLKACRIVKRRAVAREMCEAGGVLVNDHEAKPAKEIRPGDSITLLFTMRSISLEVLALPAQKTVHKANTADLYRITAESRREHEDQSWTKNRESS